MRRKHTILLSLLATTLPAAAAAQTDPTVRLAEVLPPHVASLVLERVEAARAQALPGEAIANLALEGVAKGRSADEVIAALGALVGDMARASSALAATGRAPAPGEIEAAAAAMRMGVDGTTISELARSQPSGRGLAVPMLVIGGLTARGLPSDEALGMVASRLSGAAGDDELLEAFPGVGRGLGLGVGPGQVGPPFAGGPGGFQVPVAGLNVPVGPPVDVGGRPPHLPGRPDVPTGPPGGAPIG
jgi:hypothetical protein